MMFQWKECDLKTPDDKKRLLKTTDISLGQGRRYALIGDNGVGKSTLLDAMHARFRTSHLLKQIDATDTANATVLQTVLATDCELTRLQAQREQLLKKEDDGDGGGGDELDACERRLEELEERKAEYRATTILAGLGFASQTIKEKTTKELSGGWRQRVALAQALFSGADLMLLDEPTNHLDYPTCIWLESYLQEKSSNNKSTTWVVVSHDRLFLNHVATDVVEFADQTLTFYKGDYDNYRKVKGEQTKAQERQTRAKKKEYQKLKTSVAHAKDVAHSRGQGSVSKSKQKRLDDLEDDVKDDDVKEKASWHFKFPDPGAIEAGHFLVQLSDASASFDSKCVFEHVDLTIDNKTRVGILGSNGSGKTTLAKLCCGELAVSGGKCLVDDQIRTAYFAQHHVDQLDPQKTAVELLLLASQQKEQEARNYLGAFALSGSLATTKVNELSGGQQSRVALAIAAVKKPHLLVLDEPTNHLDTKSVDALVDALTGFQGAAMIISHDQYFLDKVATSFILLESATLKQFATLDQVRDHISSTSASSVGACAAD